MKWVESVPNFSEGKRQEVVEAIIQEAKKIERVWVLDWSMDKDHNRSVVTIVGDGEQVAKALYEMTKKAMELIDLRTHKGEHPRMGATDVIPLIPLQDTKIEDALEIVQGLGEEIGNSLGIPIYFYEKSATAPNRENLSDIRKGEYEKFTEKILSDDWIPDFGPRRVHPSAGVTAIGVREFLIAYNINLNTQNLNIAKSIAKAIRNISGGFRYVKALGMELEEKQMTQVSINMTNFKKTTLYRVFEAVKTEARRYGVSIASSEIVGLVPLQALVDTSDFYLQLDEFQKDRVIEYRLLELLGEEAKSQND